MRGDAALPVRIDRDRRAHFKRSLGKTGFRSSLFIRHRDSAFQPLQVVGGVTLRAFDRIGVVQADGIVAFRNVRRQIVQQIAAERIRAGIAVERTGERAQRVAAIAEARNTRLRRGLVIGLSDIYGFGVSCAIPCLRCNDTQGNPRDHLAAQRHAREMHDAHIIVGILVVLLTGGGAFRIAGRIGLARAHGRAVGNCVCHCSSFQPV